MNERESELIEQILDGIRKELVDPNSPMYIKNIKKYEVTKNGFVLLDKNDPADKEWYEDQV